MNDLNPTEIFLNEYLENSTVILGGKWWLSREQAKNEADRNYIGTAKFVRETKDFTGASSPERASKSPRT